jgi:CRP/FNR family transcriptional regulator, cyclic AMP receptor protein
VDIVDVLAGTELFAGATPEELQAIAPAVRQRAYRRGAYLWHAGDPASAAYIVQSGLLKTVKPGPDGRDVVLTLAGPGDVMGEYHLLEESSCRLYDAVAVERSECLVLPRDSLRYHLERNPKVMRRLAAALVRRALRQVDALASPRVERDIAGRVERKLMELAETHGESTAEGNRIRLRLDQSTLAGIVGGSRENVNRVLRRLVQEEVILNDGGTITVRDAGRLSANRD